jgi:CRP-like cAMP-binding protein
MFVEQLRRAVEASPRAELPAVSALLWKAYATGQVTEAEASALSEAIELKRALPAAQKPIQRRLGSRPRSPASMERRRRWAASGALPPALASRFTLAEQAVLAVIAAENRKRGDCRLTNKEIADVAGVCITTVKNALRAARALNLLSIEERRLTAFRNASNVVRIVSPEWRTWLRLGGWGQIRAALTYTVKNISVSAAESDLGCREAERQNGRT